MKKQLEALKRIQDLSLTRAECTSRGENAPADALTKEISALAETLEQRVLALYTRISASRPLFMSAMHNGKCSGCGMQVPDASARMVRTAAHLVTCTTCGRILYDNAGAVASSRKMEDVDDENVSKIRGIARFSSPALMVPELKAGTMEEAIAELSKAMADGGFVSDGDALARLALEREAVLTTRLEADVAVPHVRGVEGGSLAFALGISKKGIVWDDSGEKVNFVVLSAIPSAGSAFFLKLMSDLMAVFRRKAGRAALLEAKDSDGLWAALEKATSRTIR
jgi:mannitol/fructose-specific phosphotransferase system IIA component (Ntr-type)